MRHLNLPEIIIALLSKNPMRDLLCKTLIYAILVLGLPYLKAFGAETNGINPRDYSIIGPSPEVAPLMDFKEYPVDYFMGFPLLVFPYTHSRQAVSKFL